MVELTNEQVRAIVASQKPYHELLVVVVRPTVDETQFELYFHLHWQSTLQCYEALSLLHKDEDWFYADVYGLTSVHETAFRECLFRLYGIERVCFIPVARRKAAMDFVLSRVKTVRV